MISQMFFLIIILPKVAQATEGITARMLCMCSVPLPFLPFMEGRKRRQDKAMTLGLHQFIAKACGATDAAVHKSALMHMLDAPLHHYFK